MPIKSKQEKKMDFECHTFKTQWSVDYFVIELDGKALCLVRSDTLTVQK